MTPTCGSIRRGSPFQKGRIHRLLTNPLYIGRIRHHGEEHPGEQPALVPLDLYERVQRQLWENGRDGGSECRNKYNALLKGILFCRPCGAAMGHSFTVRPGGNPCGDGVVLSRLIGHLYPAPREPVPNDAESVAWREAIEGLVGCPPGKAPTARQLGNRLKSFRRRVVDGVYLDSNPNEYERGGAVWRLYDAVTKAPACESAVLPV